jgi:hypothetical protein
MEPGCDPRRLLAAFSGELALQVGRAVFGFGVTPEDEFHRAKQFTVKLFCIPSGA